jgi:hypothetical protein
LALIAKVAGLPFRAPDGFFFKRLSLRNSASRSSSDDAYAFRINNWTRSALKLPYNFNFSKIELELTTFCNLQCNNCDRSSPQAPSTENMSLEQIERFIRESVECGKKWRKIVLQGGEPLLHPQIYEILRMFVDYKRSFSPGTFIRVTTNGYGARVQQVIKDMPPEIFVMNTGKIPISREGHIKITGRPEPEFDTYHAAPIDIAQAAGREDIDYRMGCDIPQSCGMGLTRYGFYPCGAGASVDRVFGLDVGAKSLSAVNPADFREALDKLCRYCGHFKTRSRYKLKGVGPMTSGDQTTTLSWQRALGEYKNVVPRLTPY